MVWLWALLGLLKLVVSVRGRLWGAWWAWRRETAFGASEHDMSAAERRIAIRDYLAWVWLQG
tara:strand:+ start:84 stop:269 length:186 start_codon:yes stop_codon:yes gene_type:complete